MKISSEAINLPGVNHWSSPNEILDKEMPHSKTIDETTIENWTSASTIYLDLAKKIYAIEQKLSDSHQIDFDNLRFEEKNQYKRLAKIINKTGLTTLFSLSFAYICGSTALSLSPSIAKTMMEISSETGAKALEQILNSFGRSKETLQNSKIKTIERDIAKFQELLQKLHSEWSQKFQMTQQGLGQEGRMYGL